MKSSFLFFGLLISVVSKAQHSHHVDASTANHSHLTHMQAARATTFYIHNLPAPKLMKGIGKSAMKIETKSEKTQAYYNQGLNLMHDFWDFEAYRAFKEAIANDSGAIMPYVGLVQSLGSDEDSVLVGQKKRAIGKIKKLVKTATPHEKLYGEIALLSDSLKDKAEPEMLKKYEVIVHRFPDDIDAKLMLALGKMSGFDDDMNPNDGQMYAEFLLRDVERSDPENHAFHHYWIHLMEQCCPEQALKSADILASLAPASGHIVHMPGHIYNRVGDYKRAHDTFVAAVKTDSSYMKSEGIQEVDNWNYIHNINYLIANCAHDGRHNEGLFYAEKLKKMPITKERRKIYDGRFFAQGILAPARMEMAFGYWDKAVKQLEMITNKDTVFKASNMAFRDGLLFFTRGMHAISKGNTDEAIKYSNNLDAYLWRNEKQAGKDSTMQRSRQNVLNTGSLELQGCVKSAQGKHDEAIRLLVKAQKDELILGYGEPPIYPRPVAISLAHAYEKAGKTDKAIETYEALLKRFPNSGIGLAGLVNLYSEKGDVVRKKEFEGKLKEVSRFGDKGIFVVR
jgi:tetratricopeptide (TPR) repeat protein